MEPLELMHEWIGAFASGNLERAKSLYADSGVLHAWHPPELAGDFEGFDEAFRWFHRRGAWEGRPMSYSVEELLGGERYGATILIVTADDQEWRQLAVYRTEDDKIAEVWLYEEPH